MPKTAVSSSAGDVRRIDLLLGGRRGRRSRLLVIRIVALLPDRVELGPQLLRSRLDGHPLRLLHLVRGAQLGELSPGLAELGRARLRFGLKLLHLDLGLRRSDREALAESLVLLQEAPEQLKGGRLPAGGFGDRALRSCHRRSPRFVTRSWARTPEGGKKSADPLGSFFPKARGRPA
jgi:hypothetical protein